MTKRGARAIRLALAALRWQGARMVHLSIAIGRFVEALFWAIFRAIGWVALLAVGVAIAGALVFLAARGVWRRR